MKRTRFAAFLTLLVLSLNTCQLTPPMSPSQPAAALVTQPVKVTVAALRRPACTGTFVPHALAHMTTTANGEVRQFDANGTGTAINDLNNDGLLDIVLGGQAGPNTILWNEGHLQFRKTTFGQGPTRAVTAVDVDGDGWRDLVLTLNTGALNYWHNEGQGIFTLQVLPGITKAAYSLNWGDLDGDGDLDLVTASYDAGFLSAVGTRYLLEKKGGVVYYENRHGRFQPTVLATDAQALALALFDVNHDQHPDILVGNDFDVPDQVWVRTATGWTPATPFVHTTQSTMSLDQGDLNNDGVPELFASDMKPAKTEDMAPWAPMMMDMMDENRQDEHGTEMPMPDDTQQMENMLQVRDAQGHYTNVAEAWGVDGTGWSWSGKFGDLDNDGYLDLYVVNGMSEATIFQALPKHELVEENQAFRNEQGLRFEPAPQWHLNSTHSGRSMVMADLDLDGDLDIVVNNLRGPAQLFENQLCGGASLEVDLSWPQVQNRQALGARLFLHTSAGTFLRDVRASSGYLSADPTRVHFGFPSTAKLQSLEIQWPDGAVSTTSELAARTLVRIER